VDTVPSLEGKAKRALSCGPSAARFYLRDRKPARGRRTIGAQKPSLFTRRQRARHARVRVGRSAGCVRGSRRGALCGRAAPATSAICADGMRVPAPDPARATAPQICIRVAARKRLAQAGRSSTTRRAELCKCDRCSAGASARAGQKASGVDVEAAKCCKAVPKGEERARSV
jgi:hypothetical protein